MARVKTVRVDVGKLYLLGALIKDLIGDETAMATDGRKRRRTRRGRRGRPPKGGAAVTRTRRRGRPPKAAGPELEEDEELEEEDEEEGE